MALGLLGLGLGLMGAGMLGSALRTRESDRRAMTQAKAMQQATQDVTPGIEQGYYAAANLQSPFLSSGTDALNQYRGILSSFDPNAYAAQDVGQFRYEKSIEDFFGPASQYEQEQAAKQILSNAAVSGMVKSGGTLRALQERGQQIAAQRFDQARQAYNQDRAAAYQQYIDRAQYLQQLAQQRLQATQSKLNALYNMAGMGQAAAANVGNIMTDYGQTMANLRLSAAQAKANATPTSALGYLGDMTQGLTPVGGYLFGQWAGGK